MGILFWIIFWIVLIIMVALCIIGLISIIFYEKIYDLQYKNPLISKTIAQHKFNKVLKRKFSNMVYDQNKKIFDAMTYNNKYAEFIFASDRYYNLWCNRDNWKYREEFFSMAKKYYKKYKIDGDKISWD